MNVRSLVKKAIDEHLIGIQIADNNSNPVSMKSSRYVLGGIMVELNTGDEIYLQMTPFPKRKDSIFKGVKA